MTSTICSEGCLTTPERLQLKTKEEKMYKAIKDIGDYRVGDTVPDAQAEMWLEMYNEPHVEKVVEGSSKKDSAAPKSDESSSQGKASNILEDYLGRNQSVVKKNIEEDNLSKHQLQEMLKIEQSDKKRPLVLNIIKEKLKKLK